MRFTLAAVLLTHPVHALLHPTDLDAFPLPRPVTMLMFALVFLGAVALLVPRFVFAGSVTLAALVAVGTARFNGAHWFVLGGDAVEGAPGMEFGVLLVVMLAGVGWTWRRGEVASAREASRAGFHLIAIGSALSLLPHGVGAFVRFDVAGMRAWGEAMSAAGWPFGVPLVWGVKTVEFLGVIARVSRRLVVPACIGHLTVLLTGMVISQDLAWFNVGPGEGGIEFPVVLSAGALGSLLAAWPSGSRPPVASAQRV